MIHWLFLIVILAAEIVGLVWWLRREYYPIIFNGWAPLIYTAVLAVDFIATWLVSMLFVPGGTFGAALLATLGVMLLVIVTILTFIFRWLVRQEITDID